MIVHKFIKNFGYSMQGFNNRESTTTKDSILFHFRDQDRNISIGHPTF